ncbi:hypothetical protein [Motiliproteus sp. MSK22-1]|uniref:hypothetical protein n=1 Tax=Motiliproteus sp. MSK22-1 TaxID=1897630 RepID=UPI000977D0D0|nr:hypothetical protein [Motiliproteus sp. MSK22-1]OMH31767.1 hypothetical protein BGP75_16765 [Motiliproteus sp. MSK22-1]
MLEKSILEILILSLLFGVVGSIEPCALSLHSLFVRTVSSMGRLSKIRELLIFCTIRIFTSALLGTSVALIGYGLYRFQYGLFKLLGMVYLVVGMFMLSSALRKRLRLFRMLPSHFPEKYLSTVTIAILAGVSIPACALPLLALLLGQALLLGDILLGFSSLVLFGVGLCLPLVWLLVSKRGEFLASKLAQWSSRFRGLVAVLVIVLGIGMLWSAGFWVAG